MKITRSRRRRFGSPSLQVRAAYLSDDGRAEDFHQQRPRPGAVGRYRAKVASRA